LYYYAFEKEELGDKVKENGFEVIKSYYSKKGEEVDKFDAENIITIAKK